MNTFTMNVFAICATNGAALSMKGCTPSTLWKNQKNVQKFLKKHRNEDLYKPLKVAIVLDDMETTKGYRVDRGTVLIYTIKENKKENTKLFMSYRAGKDGETFRKMKRKQWDDIKKRELGKPI